MNTRKRTLSILLVLAMLTLAFAALFPATVAADDPPAEIQDFDYQTSKNFTLAGSTELRFVFTIGSLDYTKAGFVFSFESYGDNHEPEVGADGCYTVEATAAYKTITADGEPVAAPDGRWWIAAKVTNIPQVEYNNNIYVRAFVTDTNGTRYSAASVIDPYTVYRTDGAIKERLATSNSTQTYTQAQNIYTKVLKSGAKTFCPTQENPTGNDLYIEYSVLFSKYATTQYLNSGAYLLSGVGHGNTSSDLKRGFFYWDLGGSNSDKGFATVGNGNFRVVASEDPGLFPDILDEDPYVYDHFPHVGGADEDNPEYGWHRIGIVYHEEVTNVEAVKGGANAEYYLTVSLYIDGVLVSVLCANDNMYKKDATEYDYKLYTAQSDGNGGIVYTDVAETDRQQSVFLYGLYKFNYKSSGKVGCCVFADCYATCGKSFVQSVVHVADPAESPIYASTHGKGIPAPLYYRITN